MLPHETQKSQPATMALRAAVHTRLQLTTRLDAQSDRKGDDHKPSNLKLKARQDSQSYENPNLQTLTASLHLGSCLERTSGLAGMIWLSRCLNLLESRILLILTSITRRILTLIIGAMTMRVRMSTISSINL